MSLVRRGAFGAWRGDLTRACVGLLAFVVLLGPAALAIGTTGVTSDRYAYLPLLGIAKGPARRPDLERYFHDGREVTFPVNGSAVHLLQHIRDESHRFAITGHRQRRQKARTKSELDEIPGVGPKRRRELLSHFGGIRGVKGASREELAKVPGLSGKLAGEPS